MTNLKQNASSIGTATHTEKHFKPASKDSKRKTRNKCINYCKETHDCKILKIECVGPSNDFCKHYCEIENSNIKPITVNALVNSFEYGVGMVIEINGPVCKIKFHKNNLIRRYWDHEVREMLL